MVTAQDFVPTSRLRSRRITGNRCRDTGLEMLESRSITTGHRHPQQREPARNPANFGGWEMSAIILLHADDPEFAEIIQFGNGQENLVFSSVEKADMWLQKNAKVGWCTRIIDLDD